MRSCARCRRTTASSRGQGGSAFPAAEVKLFVNGQQTGVVRVERTAPFAYSAEGLDIGSDNVSPVSPDYKSPFPFRGTIHGVTIATD